MKQTSCHHCGTTDPITSGECRGCGCSLVLGTEPPREEIVRSSAGMGGITERWEYAAAVDRYKETGSIEAHEAMLAAYARLNAAVSEEMPPNVSSSAATPGKRSTDVR
jgi:hypothetical protein